MVEVYSEPFSRRYYAGWFSHAVLYRVLSWACTRESHLVAHLRPRGGPRRPFSGRCDESVANRKYHAAGAPRPRPPGPERAFPSRNFKLKRPGCAPSAVAASAIIAYTAGGLWEKFGLAVAQPKVSFSYDMLVVLEGEPSQGPTTRVWSSSETLNSALGAQQIAASVDVAEVDVDNDGKNDYFDITWIGFGAKDVRNAQVLAQVRRRRRRPPACCRPPSPSPDSAPPTPLPPQFKYEFDEKVKLEMHSLAYVQHSGGVAGRGVYFDGDLVMRQRGVLFAGEARTAYLDKVLEDPGKGTDTLQPSVETDVAAILAEYKGRDEITVVDNLDSVWQAGDSSEFTVRMRVRVPKAQQYAFRREKLEVVLIGWTRVVAIYFVLWWLVGRLLSRELFRFRVFSMRVVSDLERKMHAF